MGQRPAETPDRNETRSVSVNRGHAHREGRGQDELHASEMPGVTPCICKSSQGSESRNARNEAEDGELWGGKWDNGEWMEGGREGGEWHGEWMPNCTRELQDARDAARTGIGRRHTLRQSFGLPGRVDALRWVEMRASTFAEMARMQHVSSRPGVRGSGVRRHC
ncbi:hypothetical protein C8R44DRAFT_755200 [Mycena epipterygia]|nr:hypothetical protein C8R44DRAFT_755200 [Mycena epipterygia]